MKKIKRLGIWMDHSKAYLLDLTNGTIIENIIVSDSANKEEEYTAERHEKMIHTKEQHQLSEFYQKLSEWIRKYEIVILFGPSDAKKELFNLLRTDHLFDDIIIEVQTSDKLTEREMHDFVREYFANR